MWRVTPGQTLAARQWDDDLVLFNSLSGATHLLGPGAAFLLELLQDGPASEAQLGAALRAEFDVEDEEAETGLAAMLARLAKLDLIQPCPCSPS